MKEVVKIVLIFTIFFACEDFHFPELIILRFFQCGSTSLYGFRTLHLPISIPEMDSIVTFLWLSLRKMFSKDFKKYILKYIFMSLHFCLYFCFVLPRISLTFIFMPRCYLNGYLFCTHCSHGCMHLISSTFKEPSYPQKRRGSLGKFLLGMTSLF